MAVERGHLRYKYELRIDLEDVIDRIMDNLAYTDYDYELDDTKLVITAEDYTPYTCYKSPATILDPPETDLVISCFVEDMNYKVAVLDGFHNADIKVELNVDKESYDFDRLEEP